MAKSDTDDCCETSCTVDCKNMGLEVDDSVLDKSNDTTIHSGHFMVSCIHDEEGELRRKNGGARRKKKGFDYQNANKATSKTYRFDRRSTIDATLTKLFQCMTLAYRFVSLSQYQYYSNQCGRILQTMLMSKYLALLRALSRRVTFVMTVS